MRMLIGSPPEFLEKFLFDKDGFERQPQDFAQPHPLQLEDILGRLFGQLRAAQAQRPRKLSSQEVDFRIVSVHIFLKLTVEFDLQGWQFKG